MKIWIVIWQDHNGLGCKAYESRQAAIDQSRQIENEFDSLGDDCYLLRDIDVREVETIQ